MNHTIVSYTGFVSSGLLLGLFLGALSPLALAAAELVPATRVSAAADESALVGLAAVLPNLRAGGYVITSVTALPTRILRMMPSQTALLAYKTANNLITLTGKEMVGQGSEMWARSEALYQNQLDSRDSETALMRSLQLVCTLLILLFGILAAVAITVQITRPIRETLDIVERIATGDLTQNLVVTRSDELGGGATRYPADGRNLAQSHQRHSRRRDSDSRRCRRAVNGDRTNEQWG